MAKQTIQLKANSQQVLVVNAKHFTVISCTADFDVEADRQGKSTMTAGSRFGGEPFKRLNFFETSGANNTIVIDVGNQAYEGQTQVASINATVTTQPTGSYAYPLVSAAFDLQTAPNIGYAIPATGSVQILQSGAGYLGGTRKGFRIDNQSTVALWLVTSNGGANGQAVAWIPAGESRQFDDQLVGDLNLCNTSGSIRYAVITIFYST